MSLVFPGDPLADHLKIEANYIVDDKPDQICKKLIF